MAKMIGRGSKTGWGLCASVVFWMGSVSGWAIEARDGGVPESPLESILDRPLRCAQRRPSVEGLLNDLWRWARVRGAYSIAFRARYTHLPAFHAEAMPSTVREAVKLLKAHPGIEVEWKAMPIGEPVLQMWRRLGAPETAERDMYLALGRSEEEWDRLAAAAGLATFGDRASFEALYELVADRSQEVAWAALQGLAKAVSPGLRNTDYLVDLAVPWQHERQERGGHSFEEHLNPRVREEILRRAGELDLGGYLQPEEQEWRSSLLLVGAFGWLEPLEFSAGRNGNARSLAGIAATCSRSPKAWPLLERLSRDADAKVRHAVQQGFPLTQHPQSSGRLMAAARDPDPAIMEDPSESLGWVRGPGIEEVLARLMYKVSPNGQGWCCTSLGLIRSPRAKDLLLSTARLHPLVRTRQRAVTELAAGWREEVFDEVTGLFERTIAEEKSFGVQALGIMRTRRSLDLLKTIAGDPKAKLAYRRGAMEGLGSDGSTEAVAVLLSSLKTCPELKFSVHIGLVQSGAPEATPALLECLTQVKDEERIEILYLCGRLMNEPAVIAAMLEVCRKGNTREKQAARDILQCVPFEQREYVCLELLKIMLDTRDNGLNRHVAAMATLKSQSALAAMLEQAAPESQERLLWVLRQIPPTPVVREALERFEP